MPPQKTSAKKISNQFQRHGEKSTFHSTSRTRPRTIGSTATTTTTTPKTSISHHFDHVLASISALQLAMAATNRKVFLSNPVSPVKLNGKRRHQLAIVNIISGLGIYSVVY